MIDQIIERYRRSVGRSPRVALAAAFVMVGCTGTHSHARASTPTIGVSIPSTSSTPAPTTSARRAVTQVTRSTRVAAGETEVTRFTAAGGERTDRLHTPPPHPTGERAPPAD